MNLHNHEKKTYTMESTQSIDETPQIAQPDVSAAYDQYARQAVDDALREVGADGKTLDDRIPQIVSRAAETLELLSLFDLETDDAFDLWCEAAEQYLTPMVTAVVERLNQVGVTKSDPHAEQQRLKRLNARVPKKTNTALDRARGREARKRQRAAADEQLLSEEAMVEIMEILAHEARLGRPVLTQEWEAFRGDDSWEDILDGAQALGYVSIEEVREAHPRPKGLPLDGSLFRVHREKLPVNLWISGDAVVRSKVRLGEISSAWLEQSYVTAGKSLKQIAQECGVSSEAVRKRLHADGVPLRGRGRPKAIEGTAREIEE